MCHIGTWSTRYCLGTAEKVWRSKVKKNMVCRVSKMTLGKSPLCRVSREYTRQRVNGGCRPLTAVALYRVFWFAECPTLGKPGLCRVLGTRQTTSLPSASCLPSAFSLALGK